MGRFFITGRAFPIFLGHTDHLLGDTQYWPNRKVNSSQSWDECNSLVSFASVANDDIASKNINRLGWKIKTKTSFINEICPLLSYLKSVQWGAVSTVSKSSSLLQETCEHSAGSSHFDPDLLPLFPPAFVEQPLFAAFSRSRNDWTSYFSAQHGAAVTGSGCLL